MDFTLEQETMVRDYRDRGFSFAHISREMDIPYWKVYQRVRPIERGYCSNQEYLNDVMSSRSRSKDILARLISERLEEFGRTAKWLAIEADTSTATISRARSKKTIPKPELLRNIFRVLGYPYNDIKGMLEDNPD